jgi:hypothetical protein
MGKLQAIPSMALGRTVRTGLAQDLAAVHTVNSRDNRMPNFCFLSVVYMIAFVVLFEKVHLRHFVTQFCVRSLLRDEEIGQIKLILSACEEC